MKTIVSNRLWQDFIIDSDCRAVKINNGKDVKFIDEPNGIAEHYRFVKEVYFYEDEYVDSGRTGKAVRVNLNVEHILMLADKIREINAEKFNDIYTPDDD